MPWCQPRVVCLRTIESTLRIPECYCETAIVVIGTLAARIGTLAESEMDLQKSFPNTPRTLTAVGYQGSS